MVFFRSGGDGGRGGAVVGVEHVGQAPQGGLGERYRRSPYCHSSLLWQDGADQGACGLAVGEDPGRRLLGAGSPG